VLDSLRFLQQHGRLEVYAYVIMWDHIHLIASSTDLAKEVGAFKSFTARRIIDWLEETGDQQVLEQLARARASHKHDSTHRLWQTGSHPQLIQSEEMMRQKIRYIHDNPVRKGYVGEPAQWPYSSAGIYAGRPGPLEVTCAW
jgi:REP element-mobilizing transposase RayT